MSKASLAGINYLKQDPMMRVLFKHFLKEDSFLLMMPSLDHLGEELRVELHRLCQNAEKIPNVFINKSSDGFTFIKSLPLELILAFVAKHRLVSLGYEKKLKHEARIVQSFALIMSYGYAPFLSPLLANSDLCAFILQNYAHNSLKEIVLPKLLSKDEKNFALCSFGFDCEENSEAIFDGKSNNLAKYKISGKKYLANRDIIQDYIVIKSTIDNDNSLFLLKLIEQNKLCPQIDLENRNENNIYLDGALGFLIGHKGEGHQYLEKSFTVKQFHYILYKISMINKLYILIKVQNSKKPMPELLAKRTAALALGFYLGKLLGKAEHERSQVLVQALFPIAVIFLKKLALFFFDDALNYLDANEQNVFQDFFSWNMCESDEINSLLKAQKDHNSLILLLKDLCERTNHIITDEGDALRVLKQRLLSLSEKVMMAIHKEEQDGRLYLKPMAKKVALSTGACAMSILLAELKPYLPHDDGLHINSFSTFVESVLCGHFNL